MQTQRKNKPQVSKEKLLSALQANGKDFDATAVALGMEVGKVKTRLRGIAVELEEAASAEGIEEDTKETFLKIAEGIYTLKGMEDQRGRKSVSPAEVAKKFGALFGV